MIEKLGPKEFSKDFGAFSSVIVEREIATEKEMQDKINELCDAVNELQTQVAILQEHAHPTAKTEPAGPYAEQRKWIGKLCKFWFADAEHPTFGILDFVDAGLHPEPFHTDCGESEQGWYPHCEPVKPDNDIIYKGGDNE